MVPGMSVPGFFFYHDVETCAHHAVQRNVRYLQTGHTRAHHLQIATTGGVNPIFFFFFFFAKRSGTTVKVVALWSQHIRN